MTTEEIFKEWAEDTSTDIDLGDAVIAVDKLHHKYLQMYFTEKAKLLKQKQRFNKIKRLRANYWTGTLDQEIVEKMQWDWPQPLRIPKVMMAAHLEADDYLLDVEMSTSLQDEKVSVLDNIIKQISKRGYNLKSAIQYEMWRNG